MSLFENIELTDDTKRVASRQCVAVAHKRADDRFSGFLNAATSTEDFNSRLALVEDEVRELVEEVCDEYNGDPEKVLSSITSAWGDLERGPDGKWNKKSPQENSQDINDSLAEAPSAVGVGAGDNDEVTASVKQALNFKDVVNAPFNAGEAIGQGINSVAPAAAGAIGGAVGDVANTVGDVTGLSNAEAKSPQDLHHEFSEFAKSQGEGQGKGYDAGAHTQDMYNQFAEQQGIDPSQVQTGLQDFYQGQQDKGTGLSQVAIPETQNQPGGYQTPAQMAMPAPTAPPNVSPAAPGTPSTPAAMDPRDPAGIGKRPVSKWILSEAIKTIDVTQDTNPKFNKGRSEVQPIDTEMPGSPVPTRHQDIYVAPGFDTDIDDQTSAVLEHQDVTKTRSVELNPGTETWNKSNGANPVTSAVDPDKNPIRDIMETNFGGFVPESVVQSVPKVHSEPVVMPLPHEG